MKYRKLKADKIFDGYHFQQDKVLVISEEGRIKEIISMTDAGDDIEELHGILTPGFINCHCHLELSHMRGRIPQKTGLVDFVLKVVAERHYTEKEILNAIAEAEEEMILNGIVAVGDICNNALTLPQKLKGSLYYYNFIEATGWHPSIAASRLERAQAVYDEFKNHPSFISSIVPHAPYSVSENLWQLIQPFFVNRTVSMHNQETDFENDFFIKGTGDFARMYQLMNIDNTAYEPTGKSSLQSCFDKLNRADKILLVHNTFIRQEDIDYIKHQTPNTQPETFFCLCINANQYIENAVPPVDLLRKNACAIVLGTDSLASNHSLSIADEIKTIRKFFPHIDVQEMLQWATINGAKALQMDTMLGSFEKNKKPGVLLLNEKEMTVQKIL